MLRNKILLADDPELQQCMERSIFSRGSFALQVIGNGRQAFEFIEEHDPVLVILTLDMEEWGGDECCRRVKDDPFLRSTPILLVARSDREQDLSRCRQAGCNDIVPRPIDGQHLLVTACNQLNIVDRAPLRWEAALEARVLGRARKPWRGRILNLNTGGAFIQAGQLEPVDNLVEIEFALPELPAAILCQGRVAWVNHPEWIKNPRLPSGMGVEFLDLKPQDREAIQAFVDPAGKARSTGTGGER
ncbi:two-component system response regulator [Desulfuromonas versatilis]|uniref:Two-component system response regulator n=1 Tax=Desulfuromonas versatilis TaxID=2802975 RepID=A0ABN6DVE5_9BACT|nr:response regulator [Desulfuromonas versatilis]BCR03824.1 two-component system response regulator [Desulfuromonas versatilis]